jgi:hypothetical protein
MFAGVALLCFLTSFVFTEPWLENNGVSSADEVPVTITIDGEHARNYVRMIKSPAVSKSLQEQGVVQIEGVLVHSGNGDLLIRHVAFIKMIGEPLQLLTMESSLDSSQGINHSRTVNERDTHAGRKSIEITDKHQVRMSTRKLVGGFPDSARYH